MRVEQQPGFVLHARPYRESSLLLECLTRDHGRIGIVARGVRRERPRWPRALLQPLVPLQLGWSGRGELATLTALDAVASPFALAGERLLCAMYLDELVLRLLPRGDSHPLLFAAYTETLGRLAVGAPVAWSLRRFERDLLSDLGYAVACTHEAESDLPLEPDADYEYLPDLGARRWRAGMGSLRLRGSALLALHEDREPAAADLAALRRLMRHLIAAQLGGGTLRAWSLLASALGREGRASAGTDPDDPARTSPSGDAA